ncbi:membrane lipoprotein lipid attachment site-containing protein [Glutamicibacter protophormiae]|uniref:Lipoprotein n=1 Tax=Glutamicibacter protophormiae TaxID=37930 RepID=A0ABS4XN18_GLUPR|nr:membrane lipoprotein lipid attachment site-containing protein [Glutamicibacter protophormiae]MBP2397108.1 hypothetical protein [Glutamicibacter protophormiae]GGL97815.1 hypothetical protein GCM10010038_29960 [Glutamicibacter protophormiae]
MKKILPMLLVAILGLAGCSGPSPDDLRRTDPEGSTACIHYGGSLTAPGDIGQTNRQKAAEHGSAASTESIRNAVSTDAAGQPVITDDAAFDAACEQQGFDFTK